MRTQIVGPVLSHLRGLGIAPSRLVDKLGLPPGAETDFDVVLPLAKLHAFFEEAERASGDPFLGVHVAATVQRGTYDLVEYSCQNAPTVREAWIRIARYVALLNDLVVATFEERGGAPTATCSPRPRRPRPSATTATSTTRRSVTPERAEQERTEPPRAVNRPPAPAAPPHHPPAQDVTDEAAARPAAPAAFEIASCDLKRSCSSGLS